MFTGLIQAVGIVRPLGSHLLQISCGAASLTADLELGDSVAVDGICLTVTEVLADGFTADVSPETLSRTTLGRTTIGAETRVNLEPSLKVGSKVGGHFVSGHIDGVGYLEASVQSDNAWEMSFRVADARVARYIVPKGSIAINGVSLTVAACDAIGSWFKVAVIPLTYAETNLSQLQSGDRVNLEGDMLGKYVEKFLRLGSPQQAIAEPEERMEASISPAFLAENGYL